MDADYNNSVQQLKSMFQTCDVDTIKSVLAANDGHVERAIEDLLRITSEEENNHGNPDDDNLFADLPPRKNNNNRAGDDDDFFGMNEGQPQGNRNQGHGNNSSYKDERYAKQLQEKEDADLAFKLQQEYIAHEQREEAQARSQNAGGNQGTWDFAQHQAGGNLPAQKPKNSQTTGNIEKKISGFMSKVKSKVTTGVNTIFNKKKGKGGALTENTGNYAEIDNLDEQEVYDFSNPSAPSNNMGLNQISGGHNNHHYEDAPMQLSDVVNPGARSYMQPNNNNNNYNRDDDYGRPQQNNKNEGIDKNYFDF